MRDEQQTNDEQLKIELLSQWKLEAESRKIFGTISNIAEVKELFKKLKSNKKVSDIIQNSENH